jgi:D-serine deaminase-like pyridoxal phosphate-dependent protein
MTRDDLPTPALIVQLAALDRNIATMAGWAAERGIAIRPHAKTHKSAEIARRQIAAGAVGICCAKLGEAEALAAEGIDDILITSPIASAQAIARLAELRRRIEKVAIVVDHPDQVDRLAAALGGQTIDVLVDIDPGMHRTGVTSAEAAIALAEQIRASGVLHYRGVQFYCGMLQHIGAAADRRAALVERTEYLSGIIALLHDAGLAPDVITGGGSGTFVMDADLGALNELQPGSYIFMDREYRDCEFAGPQFEPSLAIDTRVISVNTPGCVTVDAGIKAMATEAGPPVVLSGADPASIWRFMGDEQGMLVTPAGAIDPALDTRVTLLTPHCDPTVNLYDRYAICDGEDVVGFWPVTARGRSA